MLDHQTGGTLLKRLRYEAVPVVAFAAYGDIVVARAHGTGVV
jgi:hypothetical protein